MPVADDDAMVVAIDPSSDGLGDVLKRLRATAGLSQKQLAEKLSVSPQYINDLEHHRRLGSVEIVQEICDVFAAPREWRRLIHRVAARGHGWEV